MIDYPRTYFGWSASSPADYADPDAGLVVHYNGAATHLSDHADCVSYWKNTRDDHVNNRGWADTGYSFGVSVDGHLFEGRGLHRYQAAQGTTDGNANYYSVSLMIGEGETPTDAQIDGVRRLRGWLMAEHGVSGTVLGHRDFSSTSCPGSLLYDLVESGAFEQAPGSPTPITTEGSDPMLGLKLGDSGRPVTALQQVLLYCGATLPQYGADGGYGQETADAVLWVRQQMGSSATNGDTVTSYAYAQILKALARKQAEEILANAPSGTGNNLPATATISGTVTLEA
ncbi:peptidoglycan recognition protein family protein [Nocardiopsis sp. EMB25]|uniref:peptidoglycan recognition protein family protein n=1 Tax=Nocardiopsis sp. EMB25 TaxID=2835867 RepID=UPI002284A532|nr:peptidoglycan recognition family protein [Nocardiopsis sp. EMB25]MCY9786820.1 peptidoglycan recognition protein family protein [Nocardiopsis sp. EMB25]